LIGGFKQIIAEEGAMALTTGLGATAMGYFIQGWFKFGGVEFFKINAAQYLGEEKAWENKTGIYMVSAACAEFIADIFLCPLEAVRIRAVSDPTWSNGLADGFSKMAKAEGIGGFYAGFGPILAKQIPYTVAKFVVQGNVADNIYVSMNKSPGEVSGSTALGVSLLSGVIAGVSAAIISHPADTLLSKVNKKGAGGDGPMMTRLMNIAKEIGFVKLCTVGLVPRCVMIGTLTAGQFGIFDTVMNALGASKFHFHNVCSLVVFFIFILFVFETCVLVSHAASSRLFPGFILFVRSPTPKLRSKYTKETSKVKQCWLSLSGVGNYSLFAFSAYRYTSEAFVGAVSVIVEWSILSSRENCTR
jgi:solute carrier family 25 phosphate transporter 3